MTVITLPTTTSGDTVPPESPEPPVGLRLVGGEMPTGTDAPVEPDAVAAALVRLTRPRRSATAPGRVLLAGAYGAHVLDAARPRPELRTESLLRSLPDATELAGTVPSEHRITAGGVDCFPTDTAFDLVVALGGTLGLTGPDGPDLSWTESVGRLRALTSVDGTLLLGADNPVGLSRLVTGPRERSDDDWPRSADLEADAPPLHRLPSALASLGLPVRCRLAVLAGGRVVADVRLFDDLDARSGLTRLVARLIRADAAGRDQLTDAGALAATLASRGLLTDTADRWWVVAGGNEDDTTFAGPRLWINGVAVDAAGLTDGTTLTDALVGAYAVSDNARVRSLLRGYADEYEALRGCSADDVLVADRDGGWRPDPDLRWTDRPETDERRVATAAEAIARLAARLLALGVVPDIAVGADPAEFARRLGVMARLPVDTFAALPTIERVPHPGIREAHSEVTRLDVELRRARAQLDWADRELAKVRHSVSFRVGSLLTTPARVVYRAVRKRRRPNTFTPDPIPTPPTTDSR